MGHPSREGAHKGLDSGLWVLTSPVLSALVSWGGGGFQPLRPKPLLHTKQRKARLQSSGVPLPFCFKVQDLSEESSEVLKR